MLYHVLVYFVNLLYEKRDTCEVPKRIHFIYASYYFYINLFFGTSHANFGLVPKFSKKAEAESFQIFPPQLLTFSPLFFLVFF